MPTDIVMPQMGESIFEGTITKWLKKPGDKVQRDEPLFEISTDKVDAEIPAPASGILKDIKVVEGNTVQVNTVVGTIAGDGEVAAPPAAPSRASAPAPAAPAKTVAAAPPPAARFCQTGQAATDDQAPTDRGGVICVDMPVPAGLTLWKMPQGIKRPRPIQRVDELTHVARS